MTIDDVISSPACGGGSSKTSKMLPSRSWRSSQHSVHTSLRAWTLKVLRMSCSHFRRHQELALNCLFLLHHRQIPALPPALSCRAGAARSATRAQRTARSLLYPLFQRRTAPLTLMPLRRVAGSTSSLRCTPLKCPRSLERYPRMHLTPHICVQSRRGQMWGRTFPIHSRPLPVQPRALRRRSRDR